ncbi:MAG: hypothetical protein KIT84_44180 [Labilithrix sp.]|nr:hypothetical protein [Labilithrix sp.]MCW5818078.1 hypothetical protein [Labilithrix sp.]
MSLLRASIALVLAGVIGVATACSTTETTPRRSSSSGDDDDDDDDDDGKSSTSSSGGAVTPSDYATELCARFDRCSPGEVEAEWGDAKTCATNHEKDIAPLRAAASTGMTAAALTACANKLKTEPCDKRIDQIAECEFKGKLAAGADCSNDVQCDTGSCIYANATATCGKCTALGAEGADCANADCARDLFCNAEDKCVKRIAAGGDCTQGPCEGDLRCVGRKCTAPVAKDATCTEPASEEDEEPCAFGSFCFGGTCKPYPTPTAKAGEACSPTIGCINGYCNFDTNKCAAYGVEGAKCEAPWDCQRPLDCIDDKCAFDNEVTTCN